MESGRPARYVSHHPIVAEALPVPLAVVAPQSPLPPTAADLPPAAVWEYCYVGRHLHLHLRHLPAAAPMEIVTVVSLAAADTAVEEV